MFNPDTAEAVGINPIGVDIWKQRNGKQTVNDITNNIHGKYADVSKNATEETFAFIQQLSEKGFIGYEERL